jgi:outer membrane usher protein
VKIVFPVRSGRSALLRFVIAGDEPAPEGAVVAVEGDSAEFLVGRRGESYVTGLADDSVATLTWKGQQCRLTVKLPQPGDELTRVGPLQCPGVQP